MTDTIFFHPINVTINQKEIRYRIPVEVKSSEQTIKYFFHNLTKNSELKEHDIYYFICQSDCVLLFKTEKENGLTGMVFKSEMIMKVWSDLLTLINYLSDIEYKDIADERSVRLCDINTSNQINSDMINSIKKEFKNTYIPCSFITGKFPYSFYGLNAGSVIFPESEINLQNLKNNSKAQKECIPYDKKIKSPDLKNNAVIEYKLPTNAKKNIFKIIKDKIQRENIFTDNIILKYDDQSVFLNTLSDIYNIYDDTCSNLFYLDKIIQFYESHN